MWYKINDKYETTDFGNIATNATIAFGGKLYYDKYLINIFHGTYQTSFYNPVEGRFSAPYVNNYGITQWNYKDSYIYNRIELVRTYYYTARYESSNPNIGVYRYRAPYGVETKEPLLTQFFYYSSYEVVIGKIKKQYLYKAPYNSEEANIFQRIYRYYTPYNLDKIQHNKYHYNSSYTFYGLKTLSDLYYYRAPYNNVVLLSDTFKIGNDEFSHRFYHRTELDQVTNKENKYWALDIHLPIDYFKDDNNLMDGRIFIHNPPKYINYCVLIDILTKIYTEEELDNLIYEQYEELDGADWELQKIQSDKERDDDIITRVDKDKVTITLTKLIYLPEDMSDIDANAELANYMSMTTGISISPYRYNRFDHNTIYKDEE